jgi:hypothetical protein
MKNYTTVQEMGFLRVLAASFCLAVGLVASPGIGAEYFVTKRGNDGNAGQERHKAFLTVQKGLDALKPGDVLTIGPGEYFENVERADLGSPEVDTVIRADIPGTAVLRGDVEAPAFKPVPGYRFVYAAPFEQTPKGVLQHDTLRVMVEKANVPELEFDPGYFHYDAEAKTLYLSRSDLLPPDQQRYTVAVNGKSGLILDNPKRVVIEGLAVTGFYPGWGILLTAPVSCVVRDCVTYMSVGGIVMEPKGQIGSADGGSNNVIENCVSYGNSFAGITRYGANQDVIQNCHTYKNVREGNEHFGIMHYVGMPGPLLIRNNISWGQSFDYSVKPVAKERLENCVALGYIRNANMFNNLVGGGNEYDRSSSSATADNILFLREQNLDKNFEFADPLNLDFRLQPDSRFRGTGPDKTDRGPYPYAANVFYVSPDGNDQGDGLSSRTAWQTLGRAFKNLRPGDTLYLEKGAYAAVTWKRAGGAKKAIHVRGRGRAPVLINGRLTLAGGAGVVLERLDFTGGVTLDGSRDMTFKNCTFSGTEGLKGESVKGLRLTHNVFAGVPLQFNKKSNGVVLSGNIFDNNGKTAIQMDSVGSLRYSDYNSYRDEAKCWQVKGVDWSFAAMRQWHDRHSLLREPQFSQESGVPRLENTVQFKGWGPNSTPVGIYNEYEVAAGGLEVVGPFLQSASDTTANIEWWSSLPATYALSWGETPETTNATGSLKGSARFNTFSLTGLKPGQKYYFRIKSVTNNSPLSFTTVSLKPEPRVYYVATNGNDGSSGRSREQAFRTVSRAASAVGPGDTVLIAGGNYSETVRVRATGVKGRPITFRSVPGEKPVFMGANLSRAFEAIVKQDIRIDGLYFNGFGDAVFVFRQSPRSQVTRCLNATIAAEQSAEFLVQNCVARGGWTAVALSQCPDSRVENNVFIMTTLRQLVCDAPTIVRGNIFSECIRNKSHQTLLQLSEKVEESNNCFYLRWPEDEKLAINDRPLTEYRARTGSDSIAANPMMPGSPGTMQGWQQSRVENFPDCFSMNPELIRRGIGLQPEAFRDFQFKTNWVYDARWAAEITFRTNAAFALANAGRHIEALAAYTNMAAAFPMGDRLKSAVLEQAALCAFRLKEYDLALALAKKIPIKPLSAHCQMRLLVEQKKFDELLALFAPKVMGGLNFYQGYIYPELEDVMGDLYYYRSLAYVHTNDLAAAEADLKIMDVKRMQLTYRSGEGILDRAMLRLGDFYRTQLKDDERALQAYSNVIDRTTWTYWGRPLKPASTGGSDTLVAATKAASEILLKRGKAEEVKKLQFDLLKAQAEAFAGVLKMAPMLAKFKEIVALPGRFTPEMNDCAMRINRYDEAMRAKVVEGMGGLATGLTGDTRSLLVKAGSASDSEVRLAALRALLMFSPLDKVNELMTKTTAESKRPT